MRLLANPKIAVAIMISSGQISKMSLSFSVQKLFLLEKVILI